MHMAATFPHESRLLQQAQALARASELGMLNAAGQLQPCPLTLVPWQISAGQWQQARQISQAIGQRMVRLASDPAALQLALGPVLAGSSLPARLWRLWRAVPPQQQRARPVNLVRVDLLLDQTQQWRLVETNSIAAGMGPFSEGLAGLQQTLWPGMQQAGWVGNAPRWQANPVTSALADALLAGARAARVTRDESPLTIGFVVEAREDNLFDQLKVARVLEQKGARVVRLTLSQLADSIEPDSDQRLRVAKVGIIHALYFRTGYNLQDYQEEQGNCQRLLQLRARLETLQVALAPTIALQLASAKAVQVYWYHHPQTDAAAAALAVPQHFVFDRPAQVLEAAERWILKSQGEGGGNVLQGADLIQRLSQLRSEDQGDWLLMQRIQPFQRASLVPVLRQGQLQWQHPLVSELGVFLTGDELRADGYLLRSKPTHVLEAGVHRGAGMIDTLALADP